MHPVPLYHVGTCKWWPDLLDRTCISTYCCINLQQTNTIRTETRFTLRYCELLIVTWTWDIDNRLRAECKDIDRYIDRYWVKSTWAV